MKNLKYLSIILIIVVLTVLVGGCAGEEKPARPLEKITLAAYAGETGALVYIAEDQGFFKENGLEVTIKDYESGKAAADALIVGEADICTSADFVFVSNSFDHADLRAHELNNPLTSVIGFSDLLMKKDIPAEIKDDLELIYREANRTAQVVKNLLMFARRHPAEKHPVDINKAIQAVLELRAYEQKVQNIKVRTRFAPSLPEIVADGFQLQQVFLNIVINAEHFMGEAHGGGTLTITTEHADDIVRASFIDDGPGIAPDSMGHIFDPFYTTKEVGKGTGLGLSVCHGIITEHGGKIYAQSEFGNGATIVVELLLQAPIKVE